MQPSEHAKEILAYLIPVIEARNTQIAAQLHRLQASIERVILTLEDETTKEELREQMNTVFSEALEHENQRARTRIEDLFS